MTTENELQTALGDPGLMEILADIEHERWSSWMKYMIEAFFKEGRLQGWMRQMYTPYLELSEREKELDRQEVRNTLEAIKKFLQNRAALEEQTP